MSYATGNHTYDHYKQYGIEAFSKYHDKDNKVVLGFSSSKVIKDTELYLLKSGQSSENILSIMLTCNLVQIAIS